MNLLDLFFPKRCVGCKKIGLYLCPRCFAGIRYIEHQICPVCTRPAIGGATHPRCRTAQSLDGMIAAAHFDGVIRKIIHQLKYRYVSDLTATIADVVYSQLPSRLPAWDYLTPVPLHAKRQKSRGFNQSALLAQVLSARLQVPVLEGGLLRIKETVPQFGLHKNERKANMLGAFAWQETIRLEGKKIALIDDVATTIATVSECAKVLKRRGAQEVWSIVLAHG